MCNLVSKAINSTHINSISLNKTIIFTKLLVLFDAPVGVKELFVDGGLLDTELGVCTAGTLPKGSIF